MPYFKSLSDDTGVRRTVACDPTVCRALIKSRLKALRNTSGLLSAEKKFIAAFFSGLNACQYLLRRAHRCRQSAGAGQASPTAALCPLAHTRASADDANRCRRSVRRRLGRGWTECAVLTIYLFDVMNGMPESQGVKGHTELCASRGQALREHGYAPLLAGLPPAKL